MATILLQTAGAVLGGFLGPVGSAIGSAVGAMAGYSIDRALINGTRRIEGPRLSGARPFTAEEGVAVPRIYGSARVGGTLIWATRFEETRTTKRQGAKGGPRVTEYSYFANVAFALCEGEIAGIRRIWADGREIDQTGVQLRVYRGTKNQPVDPLIAAKQGAGNAPAYRGLAYVVIERFGLNDYGNRVPQFQFEVLRPVGSFGSKVKAVALIPGATEYGLSPVPVTRRKRPGETESVNRNVLHAGTDIEASLDELQMLFPNLEHVAVVATWFGDDLRAGHCRIRPGVTDRNGGGYSQEWQVAGVSRGQAMQVSRVNGHAAYGGTPSDRSVRDAIAAIKARGLKVTLYPFIMMDVPGDNDLPDPYGGARQAAYPWRGRITCFPGSAGKTALARTQVQAFYGNGDDWGYRRFVLHFARLAAAAGGVDAFLIGTELRGLTALRDQANAFPFVEALCGLAAEVRAIVGAGTALTYGADWTEYFGHQPGDGSGDVFFHLDPLWAHPAIDAVGIDNYMPLSDWRDADYSTPNPDGFASPYDLAGMGQAIAGGEGFDWYYASAAARLARERTPITDGAYGKPWVYRYKDIANWWSRPHHDRIGGAEKPNATEWMPGSKPIWFTELGCPAIDKGPNQPNVFPDPKSVENASPYFSNGGRSDAAQKRFLNAHLDHWKGAGNPVSPVYGGRMVDADRIYLWAWDARPVPAFPKRSDLWADGANWHCGHWLNGRAGNPEIGDLINAVLADHGIEPADVSGAEGTVTGYVISDPTTARQALEPLIDLFGLGVRQDAKGLSFRQETALRGEPIIVDEMVSEEGSAVVETVRSGDQDMPAEAILEFRDPFTEYQTISVRSRVLGAKGSRQLTISFPGVLEAGQGKSLLEERMNRLAGQREVVSFAVAQPDEKIVPGAIIRVPASGSDADFIVTEIEDGLMRKVSARQIVRSLPAPWGPGALASKVAPTILAGQPLALFLDLPMNGAGAPEEQFRAALWRKPWRTQNVFVSPEDTGFEYRGSVGRSANVGVLREALGPGGEGRIQRSATMVIEFFGGEAASISRLQLLNGGNAAAVRSVSGVWEVLQFETAEEIEPDVWRLGGLLRGQLGTGDAAACGASAGAYFVMLDSAVEPAGLRASEAGLELNWRAGAAGVDFSDANFATSREIGGVRAKLPLSPVHLRMRKGAGFEFSWIRRGRINADSWMQNEIALGEESEAYRIEIGGMTGEVRRVAESATPFWTYGAAQMAADFGEMPSELRMTIRQLSAAVGWGLPARRVFKV
ncbi:glycoside hydrolase/phage tail family protein [Mesorhizobium sp. SB112]|uniref:baseplate multidomain protein megatron n=1 Tax=Mesorhizobium sp. SB112 TaxID=3151853 RepID=UPI003266FDFF